VSQTQVVTNAAAAAANTQWVKVIMIHPGSGTSCMRFDDDRWLHKHSYGAGLHRPRLNCSISCQQSAISRKIRWLYVALTRRCQCAEQHNTLLGWGDELRYMSKDIWKPHCGFN
jgi:hypothetical protein